MHFLIRHQMRLNRTLNFIVLMESILTAAGYINHYYRVGGIQNNLGHAGTTNVQGEKVMQLDRIAHDIVMHYLNESKQVIEATSEEESDPIKLNAEGRYFIYFDPLDGSTNIKHSLPVGFLFGIAKRNLTKPEDYHLRAGNEFIAAGMFIFPLGIFTFALKQSGVWRFLLDHSGDYIRPTRLQFPTDSKSWELSWNSGNAEYIKPEIKDWFKQEEAKRAFRYAGSLAVDFHRLLDNGGMFSYPAITQHSNPSQNRPEGKLRLLYECAVIAFMAREAGGLAIDEQGRNILDILPDDRHQRSSLYVGNTEMVENFKKTALKL